MDTGTHSGHSLPVWFWHACLVGLVLWIITVIGLAKTFTKAGRPWWAAVIPLYDTWQLAELASKPGWWGLYPLLLVFPYIGWLAGIVVAVMLGLSFGPTFGKSTAFSVLVLGIFPFVGFPILGFGGATYEATGEDKT